MKTKNVLKPIGNRVASALAFNPDEWTRDDVVDVVFGIAFFFVSAIVLGRWWQWGHGQIELYVPVLWTIGSLLLIMLAPRKVLVMFGCLVLWVFYSLKAVVLDGESRALVLALVAGGLAAILMFAAPSQFRDYYERTERRKKAKPSGTGGRAGPPFP